MSWVTNTESSPSEGRPRARSYGDRAAALIATARAALGVSAADVAEAAGCEVALVEDIEDGRHDPTLDTVERLVNSLGLEVRAGPGSEPNPAYNGVAAAEVERVRQAFQRASEFRKAHRLGPLGPPPGVQPSWDGDGPAPPRMFGAGPTRRDGGGWAAILVRGQRQRRQMSRREMVETAGISLARAAGIEDGSVRPAVHELERLLSAVGASLRVRLEPYDDHDDGLHLQAQADPKRYQRRLANGEKAFARATALR